MGQIINAIKIINECWWCSSEFKCHRVYCEISSQQITFDVVAKTYFRISAFGGSVAVGPEK